MMDRFIIVAGYGWSGSSVVIDFLKEFENIYDPDVEFRLIKDPYGIYELEQAIVHNWDYINSNIAIQDFLWLCKKCARTNSFCSPMGLSYEKKLNSRFFELSIEYINSISQFCYHSNSIINKFKKNYVKYISTRYLDALHRKTGGRLGVYDQGDMAYFSKISESDFLRLTQEYLEKVFSPYFINNKIVILDQAISPIHTDCLKYFKNAKLIIVDRNPADIYVDLIKSKGLIGGELAKTHDANMYVNWHNSIRGEIIEQDNIMYLNFEDMVLKYDETADKIQKFLDWDLGKHIYLQKYFKPNVSKGNIGFGVCSECSQEEYRYIVDNANHF